MIRGSQTKRPKMAASTSELKTQACLDKNYFDQKKDHDVNNFPVNFSGVPHIGQKIFEFLDFKDLDNCRTVCKGWLNFLGEKRQLWIELLEKEKIKLESSENFELDNFSDCSDDSLDYDDIEVNLFQKHLFLHQLTHNMKKIVHRITSFAHVNYKRRTWAEHGKNMFCSCSALVVFMYW